MANTYIAIATTTVTAAGGAAAIDFNNIPQTYTDLVLKVSQRDTATSGTFYLSFNGTSQTNQTIRRLIGSGSAASSDSQTSIFFTTDGTNQTASTFANIELYFPNYTSSNNKSFSIDSVAENNGSIAYSYLIAGLWSDTSAITRLYLQMNTNFAQYSTATLYGIKNS